MGKTKKRKKGDHSCVKQSSNKRSSSANNMPSFLLPFPDHIPLPSQGFLEDKPPYRDSFRQALSSCYEGLVVDETVTTKDDAKTIETTLKHDMSDFFRTDVTQPFGLGTPCAKTYVTRCLTGDAGTTYKYLGLRMFSLSWPEPLCQLKETLEGRTRQHLNALDATRLARQSPPTKGRHKFNVCLINYMQNDPTRLKQYKGSNNFATVSWHADSSLEHYSTIAVYHITDRPGSWKIGLRVAPNSEGPHIPKNRGKLEDSVDTSAPAIALSLPSHSTYFLLDDFNHHHQHTVLAQHDSASSMRYSCTFRLLREGHTADCVLERCRKAVSNFHKKGSKVYRSEQILLTDLESEWLRQFYIQGIKHKETLWKDWEDYICHFWKFWSQLETRVHFTCQFLRLAAEGHCQSVNAAFSTGTKTERKRLDKRRKAVTTMEEVLHREKISATVLYDSIASLLEDRANMRDLWIQRERDPVFRSMDAIYRPLDLPVEYDCSNGDENDSVNEVGRSPMPGEPGELIALASDLRLLGRAYESQDSSKLPSSSTEHISRDWNDDDAKPNDWSGWERFDFGLEMQSPWAEALLEGRKSIETRAYDLPSALVGKKVAIIRSPRGQAGVSSIGNSIEFARCEAKIVGWCVFASVTRYKCKEAFRTDEKEHLVTSDSGYGWKEGKTKVLYGWVVSEFGSVDSRSFHSATRRMRSLFQLHRPLAAGDSSDPARTHHPQGKKRLKSVGKRKKRRY